MKLNDILSGRCNAAEWEAKGYVLPRFDIKAVREKTAQEPTWVHFGGGNIFRAFPAAILNEALNQGKYDRGVIVAETFDFEVVDKAYKPYGNLSLSVSLHSDGNIGKTVIASVTEALKADPQFPEDWGRLVQVFRAPSLQMISFTITEKGYSFSEADLARGLNPWKVFRAMSPAVVMALFTKSSAATLPVTLSSAEERLGADPRVSRFVLPICTTINMNGCAAFILVSSLFVMQNGGITLGVGSMLLWVLISVLSAVGNAGVPMGCFFLTVSLMTGIGAPVEVMGLILPIYTIIDMVETAENVWSDSCVCAMTDRDLS